MAESVRYESGKKLLDALKSGEVASEDSFVGLAKMSETEGSLAFTPGSCDEWVDVPADLVGNVEVVDPQVPCGGHLHPRVRMQLKLDANDPMHSMVRRLLNSAVARSSRGTTGVLGESSTGGAPFPTQALFGAMAGPSMMRGPGTTVAPPSGASTYKSRVMVGGGFGLGGQLGFIECDLDCCVACCRDCFPWVGCVDYPCCKLTNCKIGF